MNNVSHLQQPIKTTFPTQGDKNIKLGSIFGILIVQFTAEDFFNYFWSIEQNQLLK